MRYLFVSIILHILIISFVWVGLSVPKGHEQNSLTYLGELMTEAGVSSHDKRLNQVPKASEAVIFEEPSSAYFAPWLKMRQVDKPR